MKNTSNHMQENSIKIGQKHDYARIKKLSIDWAVAISIILVICLGIWQRDRISRWLDLVEEADDGKEG